MNKHFEPWNKKHYHFGDVSELRGVSWENFGEKRGKSNIMLTFVVIILWICLCLLVL